MTQFTDRFWTSRDGLQLHYRDYPGPSGRAPVICLPGLTRNVRDFDRLAPRLAQQRRVICVDLRGRGDSAYAKDSSTYNPLQYIDDLEALLEDQTIERFVAVGTSLGGLMTMIVALAHPEWLAGAVLNDVGPELPAAAVARIGSYLGQARTFPTWMHAARGLEDIHGEVLPGYAIADWLVMAKRLMVVGSNGRIAFDYDMKIAEPFAAAKDGPPLDLWDGLRALAGKPVLIVRGALSDLLTADLLARMKAALPQADVVTIPDVGHAPTLDEPEATAAIERWLERSG